MPNLNEYYHLLQTEKPPFDDDAMRNLLHDALERADAEAPAETSTPAKEVSKTRLNGTSILVTSAAIIALTFWGYNSFKTQHPSAPQALQETEQEGNITTAAQHTFSDSTEVRSLEQADNRSHQALAPILQIPSEPFVNSEEQQLASSTTDSSDNKNFEEQNVPDNKTMQTQTAEKQYWQQGRTLYQRQYALLDQLTQIALSQFGVKTTFAQLFAPCSLSSALSGQSTSDCILSLLERQAFQMQDSTLQSYVILAQRYKNYQMPSTPNTSVPNTPPDTYKSIPIETLPRTLETARNPVREEIIITGNRDTTIYIGTNQNQRPFNEFLSSIAHNHSKTYVERD